MEYLNAFLCGGLLCAVRKRPELPRKSGWQGWRNRKARQADKFFKRKLFLK